MTVTTARPGPGAATGTTTTRASRAVTVRRFLLVASPVLAGLFCVMGSLADPAAGISGDMMIRIYIANPDPLQWKSTGYHWAYAFWIGTALMVTSLVRGKGAWLATIAAVLGFLGMVTLPGMLLSDWFEAAIGHYYGLAGVHRVEDHIMSTMWGLKALMVFGIPSLALALPLAAAGLWRAGKVRWYAFAATIAPSWSSWPVPPLGGAPCSPPGSSRSSRSRWPRPRRPERCWSRCEPQGPHLDQRCDRWSPAPGEHRARAA